MAEDPPLRHVEVRFAGTPPARQVARAAGVSAVEARGPSLWCLVCGSFQPFLEALRGHEVLVLTSVPVVADSQPPEPARRSTPDRGACHGA